MADSLRILVVDDNEALNETLCLMLDLLGHCATGARTGARAIALAGEHPPDVVLMDISLPDQSGFDICRALRDIPALARTRLIAHSGYNDRERIAAAYAAGFQDYLVKPISLDALERLLASVARTD